MGVRIAQAGRVGQHALACRHGHGVVGGDGGAGGQQVGNHGQAAGLAHVVGVGLEGQSPKGEVAAYQGCSKTLLDLVRQHVFLLGVRGFYGLQHLQLHVAVGVGRRNQRPDILGKAGAAIARPGIQEVVADAWVAAHALAHVLDVGAELLGQVGQLVHETDARGQHGVGGVFGELGTAHVHDEKAVVVALKGCIQGAHIPGRALVLAAQDDASGAHEVLDGGTFLQELRVRDHAEGGVHAALAQLLGNRRLDLVGGSHRHRAFVHHHLVVGHVAANGARRAQHVLQVGGAVLALWRAHGDELDGAKAGGLRDVGGELQATGLHIALHHVLQTGFVDGDFARLQGIYLLHVGVVANDVVADFGQAGAGHQPDIAGANHGNLHSNSQTDSLERVAPWAGTRRNAAPRASLKSVKPA